jgi:hypothetical protein
MSRRYAYESGRKPEMTGSEWGKRTRLQKQPTILIAVALAHDQLLSPEAHHNGSLSFKYIPPVPTVVSWLRSMTLHGDAFESEFGLAEAAMVQTRMKAIQDAGSPLDAWEEWLLLVEEAPGVLMVATVTNPVHGPSPSREDGARQGERRGKPGPPGVVPPSSQAWRGTGDPPRIRLPESC